MCNKSDNKNECGITQRAGARTRGVTLVETLVAFAIVSVTFVIVLDAFLTANRATQAAERRAAVADALSYALADMAREAQVSGDFSVTPIGSSWSWSMKRRSNMLGIGSDEVVYTIDTSGITKQVGAGQTVSLLPPDVKIKTVSMSGYSPALRPPYRAFVYLIGKHILDEDLTGNLVPVQAQFVERDE